MLNSINQMCFESLRKQLRHFCKKFREIGGLHELQVRVVTKVAIAVETSWR